MIGRLGITPFFPHCQPSMHSYDSELLLFDLSILSEPVADGVSDAAENYLFNFISNVLLVLQSFPNAVARSATVVLHQVSRWWQKQATEQWPHCTQSSAVQLRHFATCLQGSGNGRGLRQFSLAMVSVNLMWRHQLSRSRRFTTETKILVDWPSMQTNWAESWRLVQVHLQFRSVSMLLVLCWKRMQLQSRCSICVSPAALALQLIVQWKHVIPASEHYGIIATYEL